MNALMTGSSGLIGSALTRQWQAAGHESCRLIRTASADSATTRRWDPAGDLLDAADVSGFDVVVHLAGENVAGGRWSARRKQRIRSSRVDGTRLLCDRLAAASAPPAVLVCASATGFYGDRGSEELNEESTGGDGFLAEVTKQWEAACEPAVAAGIRTINLRLGIVLSREGGALGKMLLPFRLGLGGRLGSGQQFMSWVALSDVLRAIDHVIAHNEIRGPVNCVAPTPVTNREFTRTLGKVLGRPTIAAMPGFVLRVILGEMAELLLTGHRVSPGVLTRTGFEFEHGQLESALRALFPR